MFSLTVDESRCNGAGVCKSVCPKGGKIWRIEPGRCVPHDTSWCLACAKCVSACPNGAITLRL